MESKNIGKVVQIVGAVVDIRFEKDSLPDLLNAIEIDNKGEKLVVEVAQHIGDDIVRCIAMGSTDGLMRGIDAVDTGKAISVPVGKETLSRMFNLLTICLPLKLRSAGRYTENRRHTKSSLLQTRFWKPVSRSSTLSHHI